MATENMQPVATVTGLYRGKFGGLEPLTVSTPLSSEEVRRNPIFYELDLHPEQGDENLIIDLIYDNLSPMRLQDLYRGTDIPRGVRFWPDWFEIPPYDAMHDLDGRRVYPRAPGLSPCPGYSHGTDPDRPAQVRADGPGPGFFARTWRIHQPGL
jgi:hypothetical protein